jgi:RNA polymerase sigma factor (sigma-70 family)
MEAQPTSPLERELLSHASWLQALARSLVSDPATADDLVQDTWVAALQRPPREGGNLRGWLSRVLKNVAFQRSRSEGRRARRERDVEGPAPLLTPEELAVKLDTQRRLAALVAELDEPYRSTLLLRYYEGVEASQIARRTGVPAGTVRWRVSEALERLRKRLDAAHDGDRSRWGLWLGTLLEPPASAPLPPVADIPVADIAAPDITVAGKSSLPLLQGLLGVKLISLITGAVALLLIVATAIALRTWSTDSSGALVVPDEPVAVSFRSLDVATDPSRDAGRELLPLEDRSMPASLPEETAPVSGEVNHLHARLLDEGGAAIAGAGLRTIRGNRCFPEILAVSGGDGRLQQRLESPRRGSASDPGETFDLELLLAAPGRASVRRHAIWQPGSDVHLGDILLAPGGVIRGRVVDENGTGIAAAWIKLTDEVPAAPQIEQERRAEGNWSEEHLLPPVRSDEQGAFLLEGVPIGFARLCAGADERLATWSAPIEVRAGSESSGVELLLEATDRRDRIEGLVLDPEGLPVPRAKLRYAYRSLFSKGSGTASADAQGRFRIDIRRRIDHDLRASDREGRWSDALLEDVEPGTLDVVLRLVEPSRTRLRVTTTGDTLERFSVSVRTPEHTHTFAYLPDLIPTEGGIELSLPHEEFVVEVEAPGHAVTVLGPYPADRAPAELHAELDPLPGVRGIVRAGSRAIAGVEISLHQLARDRIEHNGFPVTVDPSSRASGTTGADGRFSLTLRRAGTFLLRAEAAGFAPTELGPFDIDPHHGLAAIEVALTSGGAIEGFVLVPPGGEPAGTIVAINRGDAHACTRRIGADGHFRFEHLIPGPWQVRITDREIDPRSSESMSDGFQSPHVIEPDCLVSEGRTTRHDLGTGALGCVLRGSLLLDGQPPGAWTARLIPRDRTLWSDSEYPAVPLDFEGRFLLRAPEPASASAPGPGPGAWRLLLTAPGDAGTLTRLSTPLDLLPGEQPFTLNLSTGHLEIENLDPPSPPESDAAGTLQFLVWQRDDLLALIPLPANPSRRCLLTHVPAGHLRFCRIGLEFAGQGDFDPSSWPTLAEINLAPGERATLTVR